MERLARFFGAGFSSATEAKAAATELETQLVQVKAMLPLLGLPSAVGDTIEVKAKGSVLRMGMFLTLSDIEALRTDSATFRDVIESRRFRRESWFLDPVGHINLCNVPLPVRVRS